MKANPYESEEYLNDYLLLHYGEPHDICPFFFVPRELMRFHLRIRQECLLPVRFPSPTRGLDIGCATGRFTLELGRVFDTVLGIDSSKTLIHAAQQMVKNCTATVRIKNSGNDFITRKLVLSKALRKSAVKFQVGDALNLSSFPDQSFHVVAAINLPCRLPRPRQFLEQLPRLVIPGGQLIIGSPSSWLEQFTPPDEWLAPGEMQSLLRPHFQLARRRNLPFMIREHCRKYELVISEVSTFICKTQP